MDWKPSLHVRENLYHSSLHISIRKVLGENRIKFVGICWVYHNVDDCHHILESLGKLGDLWVAGVVGCEVDELWQSSFGQLSARGDHRVTKTIQLETILGCYALLGGPGVRPLIMSWMRLCEGKAEKDYDLGEGNHIARKILPERVDTTSFKQ